MANLRTSMDASFFDLNLSTSKTFSTIARSVPGEPTPMTGSLASKMLRLKQLSLLGPISPRWGVIPSLAPLSSPDSSFLDSLTLQKVVLCQPLGAWHVGLDTLLRPLRLISKVGAGALTPASALTRVRRAATGLFDLSCYSAGVSTYADFGESTSAWGNIEYDHASSGTRIKGVCYYAPSEFVLTLEAAFREVFIDRNCHYWELPGSISLDWLSLLSESGLRGRGCVHWNIGSAKALGHNTSHLPTSLLPGLCAKTAFSYEQCKNIWTKPVRKQNLVIKTETGETETETGETETCEDETGELEFGHRRAYNASAKAPHVTVSGIFGGTLEGWLSEKRDPFGAEMFGSVSLEFQHGEFKKTYGDFTKFDARVDSRFDIASALVKWSANSINSSSFLPRLNLNLQQQIVGPLVCRVNSKVAFDSASPRVEDIIVSFNYSVADPESGQVVAWWSPKRKEGMFEMRVIEF